MFRNTFPRSWYVLNGHLTCDDAKRRVIRSNTYPNTYRNVFPYAFPGCGQAQKAWSAPWKQIGPVRTRVRTLCRRQRALSAGTSSTPRPTALEVIT